ncbi:MAG: hypothetical protein ACR2PF_09180, partial [Rhizobiaceae bacterium]
MAFFSSRRERRYWFYTLAIVAAIYSTLGLTPVLTRILREQDLLEGSFAVGMILVIVTIVSQGLNARVGAAEIAVMVGIIAAYLLMIIRMETSLEERTHLIEYGLVGVFIHEAFCERSSRGHPV